MGEWRPPEVNRIVAVGGTHYIGLLENETDTVLKFPRIKNELQDFEDQLAAAIQETTQEGRIYESLGPHARLVAYRGMTPHGIKLEYVRNGSLEAFLQIHNIGDTDAHRFCLQVAQGAVFFHANRYIFCDFNTRNLLVDDDLNIKFCDLQGQLLGEDGNVIIEPWGIESVKSRWPKASKDESSVKTDLFALGTTMYFIMHRQPPFPDLHEIEHESQIRDRFLKEDFPALPPTPVGHAIRKCWTGAYSDATEVVRDLETGQVGSQGQFLPQCCIAM